ncbi:prepilin-type N-terminal cleavage/methylation domain-containing protein [Desulfobaculum xiamenense]|uniref:Prepilin-type N-terminal cleavage/methylation domain-containing protein n=1 Tax=Desulfobaculum xiamenense TaxID=995050 RepID=A0A846QSY2_9BACT|nr:type II secretion system protein [Desulfobaculum xiamenense]NJB68565.1 prepilin-type N-terminal cleavage/methylation domain-containing protein [Desulfobaculum xiamenense]
MTSRHARSRQHGFTLIEIIVTIVLLAFVATIVANYMMSAVAHSSLPVVRVLDRGSAQGVVEAASADYRQLLADNPSASQTALSTLKSRLEGGHYGTYTVETKYISFDGSGMEQTAPSGDNILKVRITVGDQTVVTLFAR